MPIFLPEPRAQAGGSDGKGWNRLSLNAHMGIGAQCALRPKSYPALVESHDTRRARWGGFDRCVRAPRWEGQRPDCDTCPLLRAVRDPEDRIGVNADRVLVRLYEPPQDPEALGFATDPVTQIWVTPDPASGDYRETGERWTWERLSRLPGWTIGRAHHDEHGAGFWIHRTDQVRAPHVTVTTRTWVRFTRHALMIPGARAALIHCTGGCHHTDEFLNALSHHTPEHPAPGALPPMFRNRLTLPRPPAASDLRVTIGGSTIELTARHRDIPDIRITCEGSAWSADRVKAVAGILMDRRGVPQLAD